LNESIDASDFDGRCDASGDDTGTGASSVTDPMFSRKHCATQTNTQYNRLATTNKMIITASVNVRARLKFIIDVVLLMLVLTVDDGCVHVVSRKVVSVERRVLVVVVLVVVSSS
jgi:hypothetical protein